MSLFSQKDQLTYAGDNGSFSQRYLKNNVTPINIEERMTDTFVLDGGWLLHQTRRKKIVLNGAISLMSMRSL